MSSLVQIMAWHQIGAKPLSEPMLAYFTEAYPSLGPNELTGPLTLGGFLIHALSAHKVICCRLDCLQGRHTSVEVLHDGLVVCHLLPQLVRMGRDGLSSLHLFCGILHCLNHALQLVRELQESYR